MSQYNQPIYVSSNSNQSLSQQQMNSAPIQNQNGPIYVSSNVATQPGLMAGYPVVNNAHNIVPEQGNILFTFPNRIYISSTNSHCNSINLFN